MPYLMLLARCSSKVVRHCLRVVNDAPCNPSTSKCCNTTTLAKTLTIKASKWH